jgi:hypothetical protein
LRRLEMPEYEVILSLGASATLTVEADSPEDAEQIAQDEFWDNEQHYTDVWAVDEVMSVEEVSQ